MGVFLPGLMHVLAFFYLIKALKAHERMDPFFGPAAMFVMTVTMAVAGWYFAVIYPEIFVWLRSF